MSTFYVAILTGVAWMGLRGDIGWGSFVIGALFGLAIWRVEGGRARRPFGPLRALLLAGMGLRFFVVFLWELLVAVSEQVRIILAPRLEVRPGWIQLRTELETPAMRALLGVVISLTPGSITYEESISEQGSCELALHVLDLHDEERVVERIRRRFEAPLRAMETL